MKRSLADELSWGDIVSGLVLLAIVLLVLYALPGLA